MILPTTKAEAKRLVCSIEIAGHRHVLADLRRILNGVRLTADQAHAVRDEIEARKAMLRDLAKHMKCAQDAISKERRKAA